MFLDAGLGYGGSCFPKDVKALAYMAQVHGKHPQLLQAVMDINAYQRKHVLLKLHELLDGVKDRTIGLLGLAFKQNTDDVRLSPAIEVCQRLLAEGARLRVHDPKAMDKARAVLPPGPQVEYVSERDAVAEGCDALVIATEWPEFKELDLERARRGMTHPILFDGRNLFDPAEMERLGWVYKSVGR